MNGGDVMNAENVVARDQHAYNSESPPTQQSFATGWAQYGGIVSIYWHDGAMAQGVHWRTPSQERTCAATADALQSLAHQSAQLKQLPGWQIYLLFALDENGVLQRGELFQVPWSYEEVDALFSHAYLPEQVLNLCRLLGRLRSLVIMEFAWGLFADRRVSEAFVQAPASRAHHHAWPSGLLEHSLEVAQMVENQLDQPLFISLSDAERDLTILAALLHDVGKIRTLDAKSGRLSDWGWMIHHEKLTLMVLAEHLAWLDARWPWAATSLAYLLTWHPKDGYCRYPAGHLIRTADQLSTHMDRRRRAFEQAPAHYRLSQSDEQQVRYARL